MLLEHLGYAEASAAIVSAFEAVLAQGDKTVLTPDVGGQGTTEMLGKAITSVITSERN